MHNSEIFMFYNVENLLNPIKIYQHSKKKDFGLQKWNQKKYYNKLNNIADVIDLVKKDEQTLPSLIGIAEVQGKKPLEDLLELEPLNRSFSFAHYESLDERGIDVALLYDNSKMELIHSEPITYFFEIEDGKNENYDTTRDTLYCKMIYESQIIHVFVLHLPSKREGDVNKPKRNFILKDLKERMESIKNNANESVIILGDFNENPNEDNLKTLVDFQDNYLHNPFIELYKSEQFSTFHHGDGLLFDQILISKNLLTETSKLTFKKAQVFTNKKITNWDKNFRGRPFRTYSGSRYLGGYSDHFPVLAKFNIN